jgi:hypothetical protein
VVIKKGAGEGKDEEVKTCFKTLLIYLGGVLAWHKSGLIFTLNPKP